MPKKIIGTRQEVWDGVMLKTSGGLRKEDLILNRLGKIVSKKMSERGKKEFPKLQQKMCDQLKENEKEVKKKEVKKKEVKKKEVKKKDEKKEEEEIPDFRIQEGESGNDRRQRLIKHLLANMNLVESVLGVRPPRGTDGFKPYNRKFNFELVQYMVDYIDRYGDHLTKEGRNVLHLAHDHAFRRILGVE